MSFANLLFDFSDSKSTMTNFNISFTFSIADFGDNGFLKNFFEVNTTSNSLKI